MCVYTSKDSQTPKRAWWKKMPKTWKLKTKFYRQKSKSLRRQKRIFDYYIIYFLIIFFKTLQILVIFSCVSEWPSVNKLSCPIVTPPPQSSPFWWDFHALYQPLLISHRGMWQIFSSYLLLFYCSFFLRVESVNLLLINFITKCQYTQLIFKKRHRY